MPFFVVAALPRARALGAATACPKCQGPRPLERRWHAFYFFVLPLFAMKNRLVAVCPGCRLEEAWSGEAPAADPGLPLLHRVGWAVPLVVGAAFLASLIVPFQLRKAREAALQQSSGGKALLALLREARGGGCSGEGACALDRALEQAFGGGGPDDFSTRVRTHGGGVLVAVQSVRLQKSGAARALEVARRAKEVGAATLPRDAPLVVVVGDFKDPRAVVYGAGGGALAEDSGGSANLAPAAALLTAAGW